MRPPSKPLVPRHPSWRFAPTSKIQRQQPPAILRWTPKASGDADAAVPSSSSVDTAGPGDLAEKNPAGYSSQVFVFYVKTELTLMFAIVSTSSFAEFLV